MTTWWTALLDTFGVATAMTAIGGATRAAPGLASALAIALIIPGFAIAGGTALLARRVAHRIAKRAARRRRIGAEMTAADTGWRSDARHGRDAALFVDGGAAFDMVSGKTLTLIGRDSACDLRLDHASIAGHHAAIERTADDELWLSDLTGPGGLGVRVDGSPVVRHRLRGGERIAIGALTMSVGAPHRTAEVDRGAAPF